MAVRNLLRLRRLLQDAADVDERVADDAETDPATHSCRPLVAATIETVSSFGDADAPSHPVRHFWPARNQRFFCSRFRWGLLVERLGMQTRLTPFAFAAVSLRPE